MRATNRLSILLCIPLLLSLFACSGSEDVGASTDSEARTAAVSAELLDREYIDSFIFFGESTTYHLKSRAVLSGGAETLQVWGTESGTAKLDSTIGSLRIVYPETGELLSVASATERKRPERMLLCFGLNGAVGTVRRGADYFKSCYRELIDSVLSASPSTRVVIASAYPIARDMDMSRYSVDAATLNSYISTQNAWSAELARDYAEEGRAVVYLDIASVLRDSDGFLSPEYHVGDGHHLTAEAYRLVLDYLAKRRI